MPTYDTVPAEIPTLVAELIAQYHPELAKHEVTLGYLYARGNRNDDGDKTGPAVKLHGYPCAATVKVNSLKARAEGMCDATITVDGDSDTGWPSWSELERRAILDHELEHLVLQRDDDSFVRFDDLGRPRLKCQLHDLILGGFAKIAERHGEHSAEVKQATVLQDEHGQILFSWAEAPRQNKKAAKAVKDLTALAKATADSEPDMIRDAFASLLSVGHTEEQARKAIVQATASGRMFRSVAEMIDAIYAEGLAVPSAETPAVESVTLSSGDQSVTLKAKDFDKINAKLSKAIKAKA